MAFHGIWKMLKQWTQIIKFHIIKQHFIIPLIDTNASLFSDDL